MSYSLVSTETFPTYKTYQIDRGDGTYTVMYGPLDWTDEQACASAQLVDEQHAEIAAMIAQREKEVEENT